MIQYIGGGSTPTGKLQDIVFDAKKNGDYAKEQGDAAKEAAANVNEAVQSANQAAENANIASTNAGNEAQYAKGQGDYAKSQGDYAKAQGDYAKQQGEAVQGLLDNGPVVSVNGKTGAVTLTAEDVGAATEDQIHTHENKEVLDSLSDVNGQLNYKGQPVGSVVSVNDKTGAVTLSAADVGAETPTGTQAKADQAEQNAKDYTDQEIASAKEYTDQQLAAAKAYTDSAPEAMQRNLGNFNVYKNGKDSNGIFTTVDYKRPDGTLYARSVLSGGTSPQYTTRTITYYAVDGTTVIRTDTHTLSYDADGDLVNEVKA